MEIEFNPVVTKIGDFSVAFANPEIEAKFIEEIEKLLNMRLIRGEDYKTLRVKIQTDVEEAISDFKYQKG